MQPSHVSFGHAELFTAASMTGSEVGSAEVNVHVRGMAVSAAAAEGFLLGQSEPMQERRARGPFAGGRHPTEAAPCPTAPCPGVGYKCPNSSNISIGAVFVYALGSGSTASSVPNLPPCRKSLLLWNSIHCELSLTTQGELGRCRLSLSCLETILRLESASPDPLLQRSESGGTLLWRLWASNTGRM